MLKKAKAALIAKLSFIEANFDFSSQVNQMSLSDFKEIMASNQNVNSTLGEFNQKLAMIQK